MVANPQIFDVTPAGVSHQITPQMIDLALQRAGMFGSSPGGSTQRWDSGGAQVLSRTAVDDFQRRADAAALRELGQLGRKPSQAVVQLWQERADAGGLSAGAGGFPRDFEYVRTQVWEEKRPPINGDRLFARDTSVPLGAKKHTTRRLVGDGTAEVYRGGSVQARARTEHKEEQFNVAYIVSAVQTQFFELLTTDWAGIRQYQNDMRMARRVVEERRNKIIFEGDEPSGLYGVLNYPHLAAVEFGTVISDAADPKLIVRRLNTLTDTPMIQSGATFQANALVTSPRLARFLSNRKHENNGGTDTTLGQFFLAGQDANGVKAIEAARELQGAGPNGEDGILLYRKEVDTIAHVDIQSTTVMPIYQSSALEQITIVWCATGGVVAPDVGNCLLVWCRTDGIG